MARTQFASELFVYGSGKEVVKRIELCYTKYITKEMIESYNHLPVRIFSKKREKIQKNSFTSGIVCAIL